MLPGPQKEVYMGYFKVLKSGICPLWAKSP